MLGRRNKCHRDQSDNLNTRHEDCDISPLEWEYLGYETVLPQPLRDSSSEDKAGSGLPDPPNLRPFENPLTWSNPRKDTIIWLSVAGTALTAYSAGMYAPAADQMSSYWNISKVATLVGVTIFTAGFAIAPMVLAPFSEINGRRPVFTIAGSLFVVMVVCCSVTHLYSGILVARFLGGCCASVFSTMVGGVVADIYVKADRNTPMSLFTGGALFGTGLGPMICGFIAQNASWRWVFGSHAIVLSMLMAMVVMFFKETRGSVLLSRRARHLNEWYIACEQKGSPGVKPPAEEMQTSSSSSSDSSDSAKAIPPRRLRWKVKADEERGTIAQMVRISLFRPFYLLFTEPVVFFFSLWISMSWSVLYLTFSAIPYVYRTVYNFDLQESNAVFASLSVSAILSTILSIYQEKLAVRTAQGRRKLSSPEGRLYFACIESAFLPVGLFWFGWTASPSIHWIVPTIALAAALLGIFSVYLATFNYLADSYGPYASSAIAAQSFCRNLMGGAFPLFTEQMFVKLGIGGASSLLGGIAAVLTLVPWVLAWKGPRIRARSKFARELVESS
ncbi:MAG: hypothetical protein M1831_002687 [Alyxoria varia]|nr:MAG: hypothetical protein M1831_002687 [Alyxoria varia]